MYRTESYPTPGRESSPRASFAAEWRSACYDDDAPGPGFDPTDEPAVDDRHYALLWEQADRGEALVGHDAD